MRGRWERLKSDVVESHQKLGVGWVGLVYAIGCTGLGHYTLCSRRWLKDVVLVFVCLACRKFLSRLRLGGCIGCHLG